MHAAALAPNARPVPSAIGSRRAIWAGRILSGLPVVFLTLDASIKILALPVAVEASKQLGFTEAAVIAIGVIEALCLALYLIPRTAIFGALLWTGYFGGAIAIHIRAGDPLFTHMLVPIYMATLLWIGLWLRDGRLRRMVRTALDNGE